MTKNNFLVSSLLKAIHADSCMNQSDLDWRGFSGRPVDVAADKLCHGARYLWSERSGPNASGGLVCWSLFSEASSLRCTKIYKVSLFEEHDFEAMCQSCDSVGNDPVWIGLLPFGQSTKVHVLFVLCFWMIDLVMANSFLNHVVKFLKS